MQIPYTQPPKTKSFLTEKFRVDKQQNLNLPYTLQQNQNKYNDNDKPAQEVNNIYTQEQQNIQDQQKKQAMKEKKNSQPQLSLNVGNNNNNFLDSNQKLNEMQLQQQNALKQQQAKIQQNYQNLKVQNNNQRRRASVNPELLNGQRHRKSIEINQLNQLNQLQQLQQFHKQQQQMLQMQQQGIIQQQGGQRQSLQQEMGLNKAKDKRRQSINQDLKNKRRASLNPNQLLGSLQKGGAVVNPQQQKQMLLQMQQQIQQQYQKANGKGGRTEQKALTSHGLHPGLPMGNTKDSQGRHFSILGGGQQPKSIQKTCQLYYDKINEGFSMQGQDQPLEVINTNFTQSKIDTERGLEIKVKSRQKILRMRKNKKRIIPSILQVSVNEPGQQKYIRPGVDLICVIDTGYSMKGKKIAICREMLFLLLDILDQKDRISFVKQDSKGTILCPLIQASKENQPHLRKLVYQHFSKCSKDEKQFETGFIEAESLVAKRKQTNNLTKIMIFSDGIIPENEQQRSIVMIKKTINELPKETSIISMGIQKEADEKFLNSISTYQGGQYIQVNHAHQIFNSIEQALHDVIEVVGQDITINLELKQNKFPFDQLEIRKTYGYEWKKISPGLFQIKLGSLYRGVQKEFAFELSLPSIQYTLSESEKNQILLKSNIIVKGLDSVSISKDAQLVMSFVNESEQCENIREDSEVMEIYFIKKMRDSIQTSLELMFRGEQAKGFENLSLQQGEIRQHIESSNIKQIVSECIVRELSETLSLFQKKN